MAARTVSFRYSADIRPVAWVTTALFLSLLPFVIDRYHSLGPWEMSALWLVSIQARRRAPYSQHNHGHLPVFGSAALNTLYDAVLMLVTGYPTAMWELQHNLGHHRNLLDPNKDPAAIVDAKGRPYGRLWYTIRGNCLILRDAVRIGRAEAARGKPRLLQKIRWELCLHTILLGLLCLASVKLTLIYFVFPNVLAGALVWWESYVHHLGVPMTGTYDGSVTTTGRAFNHRNFNIGFHTAHHEKPTLHWSLLEPRTEVIRAKIPSVCWRGESPGPGALVTGASLPNEKEAAPTVVASTV
jgi:fatty acid desaturase